MASAIMCDGPGCEVAAFDSELGGWVRVNVRAPMTAEDDEPVLPEGDFDFHEPACLRKWVTETAKKPKGDT